MREIKFRLPFFNHKDGGFSHFDYWGAIDFRGKAILEHGSFSSPSQSSECSKGWHEQYTGLKDKNGKEIYEGDIMLFLDERYQVIYFDSYAAFMLQHSNGNDLKNIYTSEIIIGNIHENPELL